MIAGRHQVKKFEFIETIVQAGSTSAQQFFFPDYPQLRDAKCTYLSAYNSTFQPVTSSNIPTVSASDAANGFVVLVINDKEEIKLPISSLFNIGDSANFVGYNVNGYLPLNQVVVKWSKSYIKFSAPIAAGQFSVAFGLYYE